MPGLQHIEEILGHEIAKARRGHPNIQPSVLLIRPTLQAEAEALHTTLHTYFETSQTIYEGPRGIVTLEDIPVRLRATIGDAVLDIFGMTFSHAHDTMQIYHGLADLLQQERIQTELVGSATYNSPTDTPALMLERAHPHLLRERPHA